jgi:predicted transcriptional regulator
MSPKVPDTFYIAAPKLNEYNILSLVSGNSRVTQAELARRCNLSVAMVNNYMKALCTRGLIEYHRRTSKSVTYHLTSVGQDWLSSTELQLVSEAVELSEQIRERILETIRRQAPGALRRIVIYGTGTLAELTHHALVAQHPDAVSFCDDDDVQSGREFCGQPVLVYSQISEWKPDAVIITGGVRAGDTNGTWTFLSDQGIRVVRLSGVGSAFSKFGGPVPMWLSQPVPAGHTS